MTNAQKEVIKRAQSIQRGLENNCLFEDAEFIDVLIAEIRRLDRHMKALSFPTESEMIFRLMDKIGNWHQAMSAYARANRYEDEK